MKIVVAGGGGVGELVSRGLVGEGNRVTMIEPNPECCAHLNGTLDARIVEGDAVSIRTLRAAGLAGADMPVAITNGIADAAGGGLGEQQRDHRLRGG